MTPRPRRDRRAGREPSGPDPLTGRRGFRVRRLPDTRSRLRRRRHYEVACFETGADAPLWVRRSEHPGAVLRDEGVHPTDIRDYVARADVAWQGGVGPWRSAFPSDDVT